MAATDKPLRDQSKLDVIFAVSSIAMLVAALLMFAQDYFREWKPEQRVFREVESRLAQRVALQQLPDEEELADAEDEVREAKKERKKQQAKIDELKKELAVDAPLREKADAALAAVKADVGSELSFYYIATGDRNWDEAKTRKAKIDELEKKLAVVQAERDAIDNRMKTKQAEIDAFDTQLNAAVGNLKKLNDKFDAAVTLSIKKEWGWADWIRSLPIIDGFASPYRVQQITNNDYGINYNFKDVTRFDRCTTCHLGIDRPAYTRENLRGLTRTTPAEKKKLEDAQARLKERRKVLRGLPEQKQVPDPNELKLTDMPASQLTPERINQFAAHPRLDLFVGSTSKHPIEKFGCTTCHNGQGSSTTFHWASHTPNDTPTEHRWAETLGWRHIHAGDWEFPMNASRFYESSCLKCHHQVTDLITSDNRNEAPKLLRGYNLIRENGCFGCHEIAGRKGGRSVGPDMRLEPTPPLSDLPPSEQARIEADLDNRPGNLRKVGPSLYRLAEKTNEDFTTKWIRAPREFRPDTKMPHFYGVTNNSPEALAGTGQEKFPDAEIHAITHYLFKASNAYLKDVKEATKQSDQAHQDDLRTVIDLSAAGKLTAKQKESLEAAQRRIRLRSAKTLEDLTAGYAGDAKKGRQRFIERGCLACHSHEAVEKSEAGSPAIVSDALFGPNLSQVSAKLGKQKGDKGAMIWLVQWLLEPTVHSPRTRMPNAQLSNEEAADIAAWLLAQPALDLGPDWNALEVPAPATKDLEDLAKVYLVRLMSEKQMNDFFKTKEVDAELLRDLPVEEREFASTFKEQGVESLKHYVGKRAVGRLGCYACHDIPGFDSARPIGVGLNDWGKKDTNKLAFEDIANFVLNRFYPIDKWTQEDGSIAGPKKAVVTGQDGKEHHVTQLPYDDFFYKGLMHGHESREGYLYQKLNEPRSYDYNRIRAWDDRSRMPQFKFARLRPIRKMADESEAAFKERQKVEERRALKEEAEAREAVATFVLGLLAEAVPQNMIHQPTGDRLAEVKGRQTLDAFNCSGCHLIRPGSFELKPSEKVMKVLENPAKAKRTGDHVFPGHSFWTGHLPATTAETIPVQGIIPQPMASGDDDEETSKNVLIRLSRALRFIGGEKNDRKEFDIPAATPLVVSPSDLAYPNPKVFDTPEATRRYLLDRGQYGGTFADLLVGWLSTKDPKTYPRDPGVGDSSKARPVVPPSLIGQGERTRTEWLYEFLLNPFPVRKMTILRMPKFNLSNGDAQSLVDYFAGVERIQNPGIGLTYPFEQVAQQDAASTAYFKQKTADYVARLKATKADGDKSMFDRRVDDLTPVWKATLKDLESKKQDAQARFEKASGGFKDIEAKEQEAKKALDEAKAKKENVEKVEANYKSAKARLDEATKTRDAWQREVDDLASKIEAGSVEKQKQRWMESEAYLTDGFKLVVNKNLCWQCHQIGNLDVKNDVQGPPLQLAHQRLRPGWTERWIANPNRFLPYSSSMPVNFPKDQPKQFEEYFVGLPEDRVQAVRDVLMVLPQAMQMPANRNWVLPITGDSK